MNRVEIVEHDGEGNRDDGDMISRFGVKERNLEGPMVGNFAKRRVMFVVNSYLLID